MSTTHVGKIGRLPKSIRDELGQRIEDGEPGKNLLTWLNELPEVQEVLKEQFGGRPISDANLTQWKQGGHGEWLRNQENWEFVERLAEQSEDPDQEEMALTSLLARSATIELTRLLRDLMDNEDNPDKRLARLSEVGIILSRLRRESNRSQRLILAREQWDLQLERDHLELTKLWDEEKRTRARKMILGQLWKPGNAKIFGGGKAGEKIADMLYRIENDLPLDGPTTGAKQPDPVPPEAD